MSSLFWWINSCFEKFMNKFYLAIDLIENFIVPFTLSSYACTCDLFYELDMTMVDYPVRL